MGKKYLATLLKKKPKNFQVRLTDMKYDDNQHQKTYC